MDGKMRTQVVLEGLLAGGEGGSDLLALVVICGGGELCLKLGLERLLRLHHQLRTGVRPAGELGGGHGDLALRKITHFDLRLNLGPAYDKHKVMSE